MDQTPHLETSGVTVIPSSDDSQVVAPPSVACFDRIAQTIERDLPRSARSDFWWVAEVLAGSGLRPNLVALLALEASLGAERAIPPCMRAWLELLGASSGSDAIVFALRESLALALDARQSAREQPGDQLAGFPEPAEAVRTVFAETRLVRELADALTRRRSNFSHRPG